MRFFLYFVMLFSNAHTRSSHKFHWVTSSLRYPTNTQWIQMCGCMWLEFICMEMFYLVTMDGGNMTKNGIWIVVELWSEVQQRGRICDSAALQNIATCCHSYCTAMLPPPVARPRRGACPGFSWGGRDRRPWSGIGFLGRGSNPLPTRIPY